MATTRRKPGKPLPLTDEDLETMAGGQPTPAEQAELIARVQRVSPLLAKLMQAEEINADESTGTAQA